jgi:hypothetical protein
MVRVVMTGMIRIVMSGLMMMTTIVVDTDKNTWLPYGEKFITLCTNVMLQQLTGNFVFLSVVYLMTPLIPQNIKRRITECMNEL